MKGSIVMKKLDIVVLVLFVGITTAAVLTCPDAVNFRELPIATVLQMLVSVAFVAAVLERALEVFLTAWRGPDAANFDLKLQHSSNEVKRLSDAVNAALKRQDADSVTAQSGEWREALKASKNAQEERTKYKSATQRLALWVGLVFGLIVAGVGFRILHTLVDQTAFANLSRFQQGAFRWTDILLTGGLIAGGSDGIHKLAEVYTSFMETTTKRAKGQS
jgi:hypothetical protein